MIVIAALALLMGLLMAQFRSILRKRTPTSCSP